MMRFLKVCCFVFLWMPVALWAAVNINTADQAELMSLKGIGEKRAQAIIDYRNANGAFASVGDLSAIKGISDITVERLGDQITVK